MLIESRGRPAPAEGAEGGERRSLLAGVRTRVLVSFLALLMVSTAASVLVLREVLLSRIGDQVERELALRRRLPAGPLGSGTAGERQAVHGRRPALRHLPEQTSAPSDGALVTFVDGKRHASKVANPSDDVLQTSFNSLARTRSATSGDLDTPLGETRYVAVPVTIGDTHGVLVVASLTAAERDEVESAVRIAIGVSLVVLLLASLFIWLAAGRAIAPLQALSRTAQTISETDLSAPDPGARRRRDRRPRADLQRHARPARDRVRRPEGLPDRRQPRAAHARSP